MAVAFDAVGSGNAGTGAVASYSWTHVTGSVSLPFLIVDVVITALQATTTIASITYGAAPLTEATNSPKDSANRSSERWYLVAPAAGSDTITVTFSGTNARSAGVSTSWSGVDQATPFAASYTATTGNTTSATVGSMTIAAGNMGVLGVGKNNTTEAMTASETEAGQNASTNATAGNNSQCGTSYASSGTSLTYTWPTTNRQWTAIANTLAAGTVAASMLDPMGQSGFFGA